MRKMLVRVLVALGVWWAITAFRDARRREQSRELWAEATRPRR